MVNTVTFKRFRGPIAPIPPCIRPWIYSKFAFSLKLQVLVYGKLTELLTDLFCGSHCLLKHVQCVAYLSKLIFSQRKTKDLAKR